MLEVAIIGAGPYGLSIAAHLKSLGIDFRIFGSPMHTWVEHMPKGMHLKSEGFASSLYDPGSTLSLGSYCKEHRLPYADTGLPVPLETFISYGREFQKRFVPQLENKSVRFLQGSAGAFEVCLQDGEVLRVRKVVLAVGLTHFDYLPPELASLPKERVSHSSKHRNVDQFKGRNVTVLGAGASALDLAALLHQAGAFVQIVARKPVIRFHDPPKTGPRSLSHRMRHPMTGIGSGWKLFLCSNLPVVFRQMPEQFRLERVRRILGPAPGWFIKEQVVGKVPFHLGCSVASVTVPNGHVRLDLLDGGGNRRIVETEHLIAATGYRVDLRRLTFIAPNDLAQVRSVEQTPILSSNFESSLPGLYFVGAAAANTFGPLLRFAVGAQFTSRRLSKHLAKSRSRVWTGAQVMQNVPAHARCGECAR